MRIVIGLLALTAACGDDGGMFPVGGGGNDGGFQLPDTGGGGSVDSAGDGPTEIDAAVALIDANIFTGRVCLATDPTQLNVCSAAGAGGLTVRLGSAFTTTAADGTFTINATGATLWRVTGANIVSSYIAIGDYEIPTITRTAYNAMVTNNLGGLMPNPGEGSVMIQVIRNGAGVAGATAVPTPTAVWSPFYDHPATPTTWEQDATEANGTIWITGLDVGNAAVDVEDTAGTLDKIKKDMLPVFDGGITFTRVIFP